MTDKDDIPWIQFLIFMKIVSVEGRYPQRPTSLRRKHHKPRSKATKDQLIRGAGIKHRDLTVQSFLAMKLPRFSVVCSNLIFPINPVFFISGFTECRGFHRMHLLHFSRKLVYIRTKKRKLGICQKWRVLVQMASWWAEVFSC